MQRRVPAAESRDFQFAWSMPAFLPSGLLRNHCSVVDLYGASMAFSSGRRRAKYTSILMTAFFGFLLACAFAPQAMARNIVAGSPVTFEMALGAALLVACIVLTAVFVRSDGQSK